VAVIGTGATAVQLVPAIAPRVAHLDVYQRTPIWLLKKPDAEIPQWVKTTFRLLPPVQRALRLFTDVSTETVMVGAALYYRQIPGLVRWAERACKQNLLEQVPNDPELRAKLTPTYDFGCKRPSFSNDYFRSFTRDNVSLVTDPIAGIEPEGVRTRDGVLRPVDVLIAATGYRVFEKGNIPSFPVFGRGGRELGEFWEQHRLQSYEGVSIPGFPNFFIMLGPYSFIATSYFKTVEAAAQHIVRCIREAHKKGADCVEVRRRANDRYFELIQRRQKNTVFLGANCVTSNSYYFDAHGDAPMLRPMTSWEALWRARHFPLNDYSFTALPPEDYVAPSGSMRDSSETRASRPECTAVA
jgi:cation diffusion facilitator CzcD-associated flavoprotein CzcO